MPYSFTLYRFRFGLVFVVENIIGRYEATVKLPALLY